MLSRKPALVLAPLLLVAAPALVMRVDSSGCDDLAPATQAFAEAGQRLDAMPVAFVPNLGQWEHPAHYVARFGAMTVFLEEKGWIFTLEERAGKKENAPDDRYTVGEPKPVSVRGVAVRMTFARARAAELASGTRLSGRHNYFLGNDRSKWRSDVPIFEAVRYREISPGIDVLAREQDGHFEYDLVVQAGADLEGVEIAVEGIQRMHLDGDGALVLETVVGPVRMPSPPSWEEGPAGERSPIACRYVLRGEDRFGFAAPVRRPGWALVVDPGLVWSTFLGGAGNDEARAVAVDAQGSVTVAGGTYSANFPATPGAYDTSFNGRNSDAFVTRLSPSGSSLVYSTFLGGTAVASDFARALAVDAQGAATVAGSTGSTDFPTTTGAYDTTYNGGNTDAFVAKLSSKGSSLVYSTFLGGTALEQDSADALALDAQGAAVVAGGTWSSDFPTTTGAYDTTFNGRYDAFVTKLSPKGSSLVYSTFLGGRSFDWGRGVAVDAQGAATVAGDTSSSDFPTMSGAFDATYNGAGDAFVVRLSPSGANQVYSTFLGGTRTDVAWALAVDAQGAATVVGSTSSSDFPTMPAAFDTTYNGAGDAFVARFSPKGSSLLYSSFLGGTGSEVAFALAVDTRGATTVAGRVATTGANFPTTPGAFDTTMNGKDDAFVARLSPMGSRLVYSTLLGGASWETAYALALDTQEGATVTGLTYTFGFPTTPGAHDRSHNGGSTDAFVTRLDMLPTGVSAYGKSSAGCKGPLAISVTSMPRIGNAAFALTCGNAPPKAIGWLGLGASRLTTPFVLLGTGIFIDPNGAWFLAVPAGSNAIGAVSFPLPIPNDRNLVKLNVHAQFLWGGPTSPSPCPPLGLSASNALSITIQP